MDPTPIPVHPSQLAPHISMTTFPNPSPGDPPPPPPPSPMLIQSPGTHYPNNNLPWIPLLLPSQVNIVRPVNVPSTLWTPVGNAAYLFYHHSSIRKCTSKTSIKNWLAELSQPTSQSIPLPTYPSGHLSNSNNLLKIRIQPIPVPLL